MMEAILLGLSTGSYCAVNCAPIAVPFILSEDADARKNSIHLLLFLLGRLLGYLTIGAALGTVGAYALSYVDPEFERYLGSVAWMVAGLVMIASGLLHNFPKLRLCEALGRIVSPGRSALLYGIVTGLNFCPPFFAAAGRVFGSGGDAFAGALYFFLFFLGTSVYFLPLFGLPLLRKRLATIRTISRMSLLLLGSYFVLIQGIFRLL